MKKGFTMIELIFVIVILGILASVAIPRLAATRDDAEVSKAAANVMTAVSDVTAYYTAKGYFGEDSDDEATSEDAWKKMTNTTTDGKIKAKGKDCITITLNNADGTITVTQNDANKNDTVCSAVAKVDGVAKLIAKTDGIKVGGSGVNWNGTAEKKTE